MLFNLVLFSAFPCSLEMYIDYTLRMDALIILGTFRTVCVELQNVEQSYSSAALHSLDCRRVVHRNEAPKNTCIINPYEKFSNSSNMKLKPCGRKKSERNNCLSRLPCMWSATGRAGGHSPPPNFKT